MKRSFLTILSLALVAVLVLCTAACSNNESEKETDEAVLSPLAYSRNVLPVRDGHSGLTFYIRHIKYLYAGIARTVFSKG